MTMSDLLEEHQVRKINSCEIVYIPGEEGYLGDGLHGFVRIGFHDVFGTVALKVSELRVGQQGKALLQKSMESAIGHLQKANHENIVRVYGWTEWTGYAAIVMDYFPCGDLKMFILNSSFEISVLLRHKFCTEVATGLAFLHNIFNKKPLVHGDIKPENVFLTKSLVCKIGDFGSAKFHTQTSTTTTTLVSSQNEQTTKKFIECYTKLYAAPEYLKFPLKQLKPSFDTYSFGVTMHMILTEELPIPDPAKIDTYIEAVKDGQRPDEDIITEFKEELEAEDKREEADLLMELQDVMHQCWKQAPRDRPSMLEVQKKLESLDKGDVSKIHSEIGEVLKYLNFSKPKREGSIQLDKASPADFTSTNQKTTQSSIDCASRSTHRSPSEEPKVLSSNINCSPEFHKFLDRTSDVLLNKSQESRIEEICPEDDKLHQMVSNENELQRKVTLSTSQKATTSQKDCFRETTEQAPLTFQVGEFVTLSGKKLKILDWSKHGWWKVETEDGKQQWVHFQYYSPDSPDVLSSTRWFQQTFSRQIVEYFLKISNKEGDFFVRKSDNSSFVGGYILSLASHNGISENPIKIKHYMIQRNEQGYYYLNSRHNFQTLEELINYHQHNSGGLMTRLRDAPSFLAMKSSFISHPEDWKIDEEEVVVRQKISEDEKSILNLATFQQKCEVIVKSMKEGAVDERDLMDEIEIRKTINHPNLIAFYGVITHQNSISIVMEYMMNGSLLKFIRNNRHILEHSDVLLCISCQVCDAMAYLEEKNIIHRNLAASSCFVDEEMNIKVSKLRSSRSVLDDEYIGSPGSKSSIRWSAPEVLDFRRFSTKSDVWAFGVTMWELYSGGEIPYGNRTGEDIYDLLKNGKTLHKPQYCTNFVYHLMLETWKLQSERRPCFQHLLERLSNKLQAEYLPDEEPYATVSPLLTLKERDPDFLSKTTTDIINKADPSLTSCSSTKQPHFNHNAPYHHNRLRKVRSNPPDIPHSNAANEKNKPSYSRYRDLNEQKEAQFKKRPSIMVVSPTSPPLPPRSNLQSMYFPLFDSRRNDDFDSTSYLNFDQSGGYISPLPAHRPLQQSYSSPTGADRSENARINVADASYSSSPNSSKSYLHVPHHKPIRQTKSSPLDTSTPGHTYRKVNFLNKETVSDENKDLDKLKDKRVEILSSQARNKSIGLHHSLSLESINPKETKQTFFPKKFKTWLGLREKIKSKQDKKQKKSDIGISDPYGEFDDSFKENSEYEKTEATERRWSFDGILSSSTTRDPVGIFNRIQSIKSTLKSHQSYDRAVTEIEELIAIDPNSVVGNCVTAVETINEIVLSENLNKDFTLFKLMNWAIRLCDNITNPNTTLMKLKECSESLSTISNCLSKEGEIDTIRIHVIPMQRGIAEGIDLDFLAEKNLKVESYCWGLFYLAYSYRLVGQTEKAKNTCKIVINKLSDDTNHEKHCMVVAECYRLVAEMTQNLEKADKIYNKAFEVYKKSNNDMSREHCEDSYEEIK